MPKNTTGTAPASAAERPAAAKTEKPAAPQGAVSYTHLTLPTIYAV